MDDNRTAQHLCIELRINIYKRGKHIIFDSNPPIVKKSKVKINKITKNIIAEAVKIKTYLQKNELGSYLAAGNYYNITKARICQLHKIANSLPAYFIEEFKNCKNPTVLKKLSGKKLLKIISKNNTKQITLDFADLACYLNVLEKSSMKLSLFIKTLGWTMLRTFLT